MFQISFLSPSNPEGRGESRDLQEDTTADLQSGQSWLNNWPFRPVKQALLESKGRKSERDRFPEFGR